jgi:hypothetical protein
MGTIYTQADVGAYTTLDSGLYTIALWSNHVKSEQKDTVFLQASSQSIPYFLILDDHQLEIGAIHFLSRGYLFVVFALLNSNSFFQRHSVHNQSKYKILDILQIYNLMGGRRT